MTSRTEAKTRSGPAQSEAPYGCANSPAAGVVHTLHPGDVVCAERGDRLETLLGSCVAVALIDRARRVGTLCHIVHTQPAVAGNGIPTASADAAIDEMYRLLTKRSLAPRLCHAYVYGGGNMFPSLFEGTHVGVNNGRHVIDRLGSDGVRILFVDLGGNTYRRLRWTIGPEMPDVTAVVV